MRIQIDNLTDKELEDLKAQIETKQEERRISSPEFKIEEWEKTSGQVRQSVTVKNGDKTYRYASGLILQHDRYEYQIQIGVANPQRHGEYIHWAKKMVLPDEIQAGIEKYKSYIRSCLTQANWHVSEYETVLAKLSTPK